MGRPSACGTDIPRYLVMSSRLLLLLACVAAANALLGPRDKAPDFTATAVVGDKFETVKLGDYFKGGKWVVLFFCACAAAPRLSRVSARAVAHTTARTDASPCAVRSMSSRSALLLLAPYLVPRGSRLASQIRSISLLSAPQRSWPFQTRRRSLRRRTCRSSA